VSDESELSHIENVVIAGSHWKESDLETLFGDEEVQFVQVDSLQGLLAHLGVYRTRSESRRAGRWGDIPDGWTELKASKKKRLWIWNPTF